MAIKYTEGNAHTPKGIPYADETTTIQELNQFFKNWYLSSNFLDNFDFGIGANINKFMTLVCLDFNTSELNGAGIAFCPVDEIARGEWRVTDKVLIISNKIMREVRKGA